MCMNKYSFSLLSIFFILLMGTFACQPKKSTPDHAGPTADNREKVGHTWFHTRQLRMGTSNADEHLENQREESNPITAEDPEMDAGSKGKRVGTSNADEHLENQREESNLISAEDPEIEAGSKGERVGTSNADEHLENQREESNLITAEDPEMDAGSKGERVGTSNADEHLENQREESNLYAEKDPEIEAGSKGGRDEHLENQQEESKRFTAEDPEIYAGSKGGRETSSFGFMIHNYKNTAAEARSNNAIAIFKHLVDDLLDVYLRELGLFPFEQRRMRGPNYTLVDSPKVSEGNGNIHQRKKRKQRKRKTRRANLGQGDQAESDIVDKKSSRNEDIATMGQWTLYVTHAIVFLAGLSFGYCVLCHSKKQPTQETEDVDPTINAKNTEDTERHSKCEPASRKWNRRTADDQGNADTSEVISWETQKKNQQQQKDRSQSDNDSKHKLDCGEDKAKSQTWTGQQPAIETGRTFAYKTDYIHPPSISKAGMQKPEENKGGNDALGESERGHLIHSESKSDAEQKTGTVESQAVLPTTVGQQTDSKSEDSMTNKLYEDQPVTSPVFELKSSESMPGENEFKENAALPQEIIQETPKENKQHQEDRSQSDNDSDFKLDADQVQPTSQPRSGQQTAIESEKYIVKKTDEVQTLSTPGAEMQNPKENIVGNHALGESERSQLIHRESKCDAEQKTGTVESQAELPTTVGQQTDSKSEDNITNKLYEDQLVTSPVLELKGSESMPGENVVEQLHMRHLRDQSKHWKGTENEGSLLTEKRNFDHFYTDICVIATPQKRLFIEHDVMQEENNKQEVQVDFHQLFKSDKSLTNNAAITVVCGAAGTGKSTMIQKIINDWSTGTMYKAFKFVLHFRLRQLNAIKHKTNLITLILDAYPHFEGSLDHLWKETNNILFILEDFDQFEGIGYFQDEMKKENKQQEYLEPQSLCLVSDIVNSLLQGGLLRGCSVLITTRPWNLDTLREASIDSTFQIIGFTADQVKQYFRRNGLQENVIKLIEQSDILRSMCRNPLFCSALNSSLKSQQIQGERTTYVICNSRVFSAYYAILLDRCGYNVKSLRNSFHKLGELAYTGICNKKESFESDKLSDLNFYLPNFASTFMIQVQDNTMNASVYKFTHSFVRDFVAALSKRLHTKGFELQRILDQTFTSTDDRWNIFSRFLFGLCSGQSTDLLEGLLGKCFDDVSLCISDWLSETIKRRTENLERKYTQNKFLNILHCLSEFGDVQLTKNALTVKRAIKFNQCVLRPSDCTVICTTLTCPEAITEMDLSSCCLQLEGIQQLEPILHKCETLRLSGNDLQDAGVKCVSEALKKVDCKVKQLELKSNKLTDDCLEDLFCALAGNRSLMVLDLSNSTHDEHQANRFATGNLQNMEKICNSKRDIRLIRNQDFKQNPSKDDIALNFLTIITD